MTTIDQTAPPVDAELSAGRGAAGPILAELDMRSVLLTALGTRSGLWAAIAGRSGRAAG